MAIATLDLRLPSQIQDIAAMRLVLNYTAWWQRHMCVNNLPKVVNRVNLRQAQLVLGWVTVRPLADIPSLSM